MSLTHWTVIVSAVISASIQESVLPELVCFHVPVRSAGCSTGFFSAGFFVVCDWLVLPASAVLASLALPHAPSPRMSRPATAVAIVFLYMVSFFPWLICIKNSISWRFRFESLVRIVVGSHVKILRTGSDTVNQLIRDPKLALAGLCAVSTVDKFFSLFNEFMWIDSEDF